MTKAIAPHRWVWSETAERKSGGKRAKGTPVWSHWEHEAPGWLLERGLIMDKDDAEDGQLDLLEFI